MTVCYLLPCFIILKGALRQPGLHKPRTDRCIWTQKKTTTDHSFSHFSKFYLDSPARSCFKHGVCSEPGALSTAQPPFPKPFIPTRQPAALQGQWDELLRGEAAEPHEAPSQTRGAGGLCSASALCEVQIEVAMCAA